jgi:ABC-type glycerol-3-phosphate transport system substrate-binding protein
MRRLLIGLAAASIATAASAASASAHSDGSWTYVDSKGRDIHADYYAKGMAEYNARHGYHDDWNDHRGDWNEHGNAPRRHGRAHKAVSPQ